MNIDELKNIVDNGGGELVLLETVIGEVIGKEIDYSFISDAGNEFDSVCFEIDGVHYDVFPQNGGGFYVDVVDGGVTGEEARTAQKLRNALASYKS